MCNWISICYKLTCKLKCCKCCPSISFRWHNRLLLVLATTVKCMYANCSRYINVTWQHVLRCCNPMPSVDWIVPCLIPSCINHRRPTKNACIRTYRTCFSCALEAMDAYTIFEPFGTSGRGHEQRPITPNPWERGWESSVAWQGNIASVCTLINTR